jgi:serine/threonine protein kinase
MYNDLRSSLYVRGSDDDIPGESMFAYKYLRSHLLSVAQKDVPLRHALRGIADMHVKGIIHAEIKANNILVDWHDRDGEAVVEKVQVTGIEDAAYVPDDCVIHGRQLGNYIWRSPEAYAATAVQKLSDIWSFGLVVRLRLAQTHRCKVTSNQFSYL